jgi:surfactin synthase thioesterase subunit
MTASVNPWVQCQRPNPRAALRLFCFPYAGGGATAYRAWSDALPRSVEVCCARLPGREMRIKEPAYSDVYLLVDALAPALVPLLERPFALFGHSMGALVAFELARKLRRDHNLLPERLLVSARIAPSMKLKHSPLNILPDDEFIDALAKLNGTDENALQHRELMKLVLPALRADVAMHEQYKYSEGTPLECPIVAFGGLQDPKVDNEGLDAWRNHTTGPFTKRLLAGDHFFINSPQSSFLNIFALELQRMVAAQGGRVSPAKRPPHPGEAEAKETAAAGPSLHSK